MSDAPNPPPKPQRPIWRDLLVSLTAGAMGGFAVAVVSIGIGITLDLGIPTVPLQTLLDRGVHLGQVYERIDDRFLGGPFMGMIGGPISMLFVRCRRNPFLLAVLWASMLGALALTLVAISLSFGPPPRLDDALMMISIAVGCGATYGFVLGLSQLYMERVLDRFMHPRIEDPTGKVVAEDDDSGGD